MQLKVASWFDCSNRQPSEKQTLLYSSWICYMLDNNSCHRIIVKSLKYIYQQVVIMNLNYLLLFLHKILNISSVRCFFFLWNELWMIFPLRHLVANFTNKEHISWGLYFLHFWNQELDQYSPCTTTWKLINCIYC